MLVSALLVLAAAAPAWALDLTHATVVLPPAATPRERNAARMLAEEVGRRTRLEWPVAERAPGASIRLARGSGPAEGYTIRTSAAGVTIAGNDARGILFGVGCLLRHLRMTRDAVALPDDFQITTAYAQA